MLTEAEHNLSALAGVPFSADPADLLIEAGDVIEQASIKLQVLHTPGHTPGGICLYSKDEGIVFTDDTLFADSIGRTDFPNGSKSQLLNSIKEKLFTLSLLETSTNCFIWDFRFTINLPSFLRVHCSIIHNLPLKRKLSGHFRRLEYRVPKCKVPKV